MLTGRTAFQMRSKAAVCLLKKPNQTSVPTTQRSLVTLWAVAVAWGARKRTGKRELETWDHSTLSSSFCYDGKHRNGNSNWRGTGKTGKGFLSVSPRLKRGEITASLCANGNGPGERKEWWCRKELLQQCSWADGRGWNQEPTRRVGLR